MRSSVQYDCGIQENTEQLISLGGGAAVFHLRTKRPHLDADYLGVMQHLTARRMASQPTVRSSYK
jgi:hypothetical protein